MLIDQLRLRAGRYTWSLIPHSSHFFFTVTVKLQLAVLFDASVAEQLTVVVPIGKLDPDGGVHVTVTGLQLSVAVTA